MNQQRVKRTVLARFTLIFYAILIPNSRYQDPTKVSALGTLAQTATAKDAFPSTLIQRSKSSSPSTCDVVTMNKNAIITSHLVIILSRIRQRKKSLRRIVSESIPLLRKCNQQLLPTLIWIQSTNHCVAIQRISCFNFYRLSSEKQKH